MKDLFILKDFFFFTSFNISEEIILVFRLIIDFVIPPDFL